MSACLLCKEDMDSLYLMDTNSECYRYSFYKIFINYFKRTETFLKKKFARLKKIARNFVAVVFINKICLIHFNQR